MMGRPYSDDLRERIVEAVEGGKSRRGAAEIFGVSPSCAVKLYRRWRETGSVRPQPVGAPKRCKLDPLGDWLEALVKAEPDLTLNEIRVRLAQEHGVSASIGLVWAFLDRRGLSFKKNGARQRAGARRRGAGPGAVEGSPTLA
jgi:transposase